ncbi:acyl carrier protein [Janthinobacterium sp.]|jgi:acyl carrier protein|uniref:acyl carrier protein n=1 Tax=Janthinobacterium sp. TaxID=1871054 RepID=UPI002896C153|nr:acyl carrier protein [Janthinobacterium sp.]
MPQAEAVIAILRTTLGLGNRPLAPGTPLLGSVPELDSMAVIGVITALEDHFGITVEDDDIHARHFASVATLQAFVDAKLAQADLRR